MQERFAVELAGWSFKFNKNKSRAGVCKYRTKTIEMSHLFLQAPNTDEAKTRNIVLHEVAHALTPLDKGHGPHWQATARSIGCDGKRCCEPFMQPHHYNYVIKCEKGCSFKRVRVVRSTFKHSVCRVHREKLVVHKYKIPSPPPEI